VTSDTPTKDGEALSRISTISRAGNGAAKDSGPDASTQWFAVYTTHRHEKRVSELLLDREIETVLPLYRAGRQWKKRAPVVLELPLFPCYLFVNISRLSGDCSRCARCALDCGVAERAMAFAYL